MLRGICTSHRATIQSLPTLVVLDCIMEGYVHTASPTSVHNACSQICLSYIITHLVLVPKIMTNGHRHV